MAAQIPDSLNQSCVFIKWHNFFKPYYTTTIDNINAYVPMKKWSILPLLALVFALSGCELVGDIFQAGMVMGIVIVVVVVGVVLWLLSKLFGRRR